MRRLKPVIAGVLTVLMSNQATGCTSWKAVAQPVPGAVAQHPGRKVQVVLSDGRTIDADSAKADTEALVAYHRERVSPGFLVVVDTIPLSQVKAVKVRQSNGLKTFGLIAGMGAIAWLVLAGIVVALNEADQIGY